MKNSLEQYIRFQELRINADAELQVLLAQRRRLIPSKDSEKCTEMDLRIINQQTYISRIDEIVKRWSDALIMLASTYGDKELEMFVTLIVRQTPPHKVKKWSKSACYRFINEVNNQIQALKEKGGN